MNKLLGVLICLFVSTHFAVAQTGPATAGPTAAVRVSVQGANCALFLAAAQLPTWPAKVRRHPARFTPTLAQAAAAEQALRQVQLLLVNAGRKTSQDSSYARDIAAHLGSYLRQYFGYYNRQRQPCLRINLLHSDFFQPEPGLPAAVTEMWLREPVFLSDGGSGHWSISYNLATRQFFHYWHNLGLGGS